MDKQTLQEIVNNSNSYSEILKSLNRSKSGASLKKLKQELQDLGIIPVFNNNRINNFKGKNIEDMTDSKSVLNKIVKQGLKEYKCECCGVTEWNGNPLRLQLHHIDGNHFNNKIENLQILCPNCHSQTDNWGCKTK